MVENSAGVDTHGNKRAIQGDFLCKYDTIITKTVWYGPEGSKVFLLCEHYQS